MKAHHLSPKTQMAVIVMLLLPFLASAQEIPYRTSFEAPVFTPGPLGAGKDGWVGEGAIQNATPGAVRTGSQSLQVLETGVVSRSLTSPAGKEVTIDGYYRGPTVNSKPNPLDMDLGSSLLLFHGTDGILALDGDGSGGGEWISTGVMVSNSSFQRITIRQNYATHTWTLYIDGQQVPQGNPQTFGFKDNSINQLSGIDIETSNQGKGYLDDFSATTSVPEFFAASLFDFSLEWQEETPMDLNWDLVPVEGRVDSKDLLELLERILKG